MVYLLVYVRLSVVDDEPKEAKGVQISGVAVMQDDRICGYLDSSEALMMLVLDGNIKQNEINVPLEGIGNVGLYFVKCDSKKNVGLRDGSPYADIAVSLRFDINEIQNAPQELTPEELEKIRQGLELYFEQSCDWLLGKLTHEMCSDVFGIGREMMMRETAYFKSVSDRWREILPTVATHVDVEVQLRRSGHESVQISA